MNRTFTRGGIAHYYPPLAELSTPAAAAVRPPGPRDERRP